MPGLKLNNPKSTDRSDSENGQMRSVGDHVEPNSPKMDGNSDRHKEMESANRPYFGVQEPDYTQGGGFGRHHDRWFGETQPGSLAGVSDYASSACGHIAYCGRGGYRGSHAGYQGND